MAKYSVGGGGSNRPRSYRKGRPAVIEEFRNSGFTRREARALSMFASDDIVVKRMRRTRLGILHRFNKSADPEWSVGKNRYEWNKRIREYYIKHSYFTIRSAGEKKRETSIYSAYRDTKRRMANVVGIAPKDFENTAKKYPKRKGNLAAQRARSRVRARATLEGRGTPKSNTAHVKLLRDWVRQLGESISNTLDLKAKGQLIKQRNRLRADIKLIVGKKE